MRYVPQLVQAQQALMIHRAVGEGGTDDDHRGLRTHFCDYGLLALGSTFVQTRSCCLFKVHDVIQCTDWLTHVTSHKSRGLAYVISHAYGYTLHGLGIYLKIGFL